MRLRLHDNANATTLAAARILICLVWIVRLSCSRFGELGYLSPELFYGHGIMALMPAGLIPALTSPGALMGMQLVGCLVFLLAAIGIKGGRLALAVGAVVTTVLFGLAKGYGGHVNHRELLLLYLTYALIILPCFDGLSIRRQRSAREVAVYAASMQLLCSIILLNYFFVGIARVFVGFPDVFEPQLMYAWVADRNLRPNPYDFGVGWMLLQSGGGRAFLAAALPISTIIEVLAPLALWRGGRLAVATAVALAGFHLSIFMIMNIPFLENVALLLLLTPYAALLDRRLAEDAAPAPENLVDAA